MNATVMYTEKMLDASWLSDALGAQVTATSLRAKPGTSLTASFTSSGAEGQDASGWVRLMWPAGAGKAEKHRRKAAKLGLSVQQSELPDGFTLQWGGVKTDPKLMMHLVSFEGLNDGEILRYNPLRRLVIRNGYRVSRIVTSADPHSTDLYRFVGLHVPVPEVLDADTGTGMDVLRFVGTRDLSSGLSTTQATSVGALFAGLHASVSSLPNYLNRHLAAKNISPAVQLEAHASLFDVLAPELAGRTRALAAAFKPLSGPPVLLHGDASPDQVLTDEATGALWLTDFDRAYLGPAPVDIGSFMATSPTEVSAAFFEGYSSTAGHGLPVLDLQHALAGALALRLADPLRGAQPGWKAEVEAALSRIEQML